MSGDAADFSCDQVWASLCNGWSLFWCVAPSHPKPDHPPSSPHWSYWRQCVIGFWGNFILRSILHTDFIPFLWCPRGSRAWRLYYFCILYFCIILFPPIMHLNCQWAQISSESECQHLIFHTFINWESGMERKCTFLSIFLVWSLQSSVVESG